MVNMKQILQTLLAVLALLTTSLSWAQNIEGRQDLDALQTRVEKFLKSQSVGMPGKVDVVVSPIDPRNNLAPCSAPEAFLPPGKRAWGKTTVGVRCATPVKWTIFVKATVKVNGEYVVAAHPLLQGQIITEKDLVKTTGDLTALPPGAITTTADAIGKKVSMSLALGTPIRKEWLRNQQVIQSGQTVRLISQGTGFRITSEAKALGSASEGQMVQTRTSSGQTVSGIARLGGVVEIVF